MGDKMKNMKTKATDEAEKMKLKAQLKAEKMKNKDDDHAAM